MLYLYIKNVDLSKIGKSKYFSASNALRLFSFVRYLNALFCNISINCQLGVLPLSSHNQKSKLTSALILPAKSQVFCIYTLNLFSEDIYTLNHQLKKIETVLSKTKECAEMMWVKYPSKSIHGAFCEGNCYAPKDDDPLEKD